MCVFIRRYKFDDISIRNLPSSVLGLLCWLAFHPVCYRHPSSEWPFSSMRNCCLRLRLPPMKFSFDFIFVFNLLTLLPLLSWPDRRLPCLRRKKPLLHSDLSSHSSQSIYECHSKWQIRRHARTILPWSSQVHSCFRLSRFEHSHRHVA